MDETSRSPASGTYTARLTVMSTPSTFCCAPRETSPLYVVSWSRPSDRTTCLRRSPSTRAAPYGRPPERTGYSGAHIELASKQIPQQLHGAGPPRDQAHRATDV